MSLLTFLFGEKPKSASMAKERLHLIIAREKCSGNSSPDFLPKLRDELVAVISKYVHIDSDGVKFNVQKQDNLEVLEVNIVLPDQR
jgi:cell division topological specificity factor